MAADSKPTSALSVLGRVAWTLLLFCLAWAAMDAIKVIFGLWIGLVVSLLIAYTCLYLEERWYGR